MSRFVLVSASVTTSAVAIAVAIAVAACSSGPDKSTVPAGSGGELDASPRIEPSTDGDVRSADITDAECHAFFRHLLTLGAEEMRATKAPEEVPTQEQIDAIHRGMIGSPDKMKRCREQPRWAIECAMAARSTKVVAACEGKANPSGPDSAAQ